MVSIASIVNSTRLPSNIKEETVTYTVDGMTFKGFITYDDNIKGKWPAIMVVPE